MYRQFICTKYYIFSNFLFRVTCPFKRQCLEKPKMRTFVQFKSFGELPSYVTKPLTFVQRRYLAQLRTGTLPLRLETGRFARPFIPEHERLCQICDRNSSGGNNVENEYHFLFICNVYSKIRNDWMSSLNLEEHFWSLESKVKLDLVLNKPEYVKQTAKYITEAYNMRGTISNANLN